MGKLRLLLALSVVAAHGEVIWKFNLVGGPLAVQSFFIISGFYMSLILNEKYIGSNNSYRLFITNRLLRIYPIYWTVLLGVVLFSLLIIAKTHGHSLDRFTVYAETKTSLLSLLYLILSQILIFGQDIIMFLGITPGNGNFFFTTNFANTHPPLYTFLFIPQAWTLGLELTFYLIAPFVLRKGIKFVVLLIILSLSLRFFIYNYWGLHNDPWTYRFFPTELMFFLFGYVSYRIYLVVKKMSISRYLNLSILCAVILFMVLFPFLPSNKISFIPFSFKEILLFGIMTTGIPILFNFQKNNKIDTQIGELSYPVYIVHMAVLMICALSFMPKSAWFMILLTIFIAYLLNKFVASPIEKLRQRRLVRIPNQPDPPAKVDLTLST
jgi:peptidoglycan/LPS O-acetylase OafA/YrhL